MADLARQAGKEISISAPENQNRLKMGEFPEGADIVENPFNKIPGFSVAHRGGQGAHYFVPGFPVMAGPMIEWVLDHIYPHLFHQVARLEKAVLVYGSMESTLTPLMEAIETQFPLAKVFSLPHVGDAVSRRYIELGVKGEPVEVAAAFERLTSGLDQLNVEYRPV